MKPLHFTQVHWWVTTEKDAVKCRGLGLADAWFLPVDAQLPSDFEESLVARAKDLVKGVRK